MRDKFSQFYFILICIMHTNVAYPLSRLTISIIVPCNIKHLKFIPDLLTELTQQTVLPDEVIVIISPFNNKIKPDTELIKKIKQFTWPYNLQLILLNDKKSAGESRNVGCGSATKSILICHDADDISHPQRIEIIRNAFEKNDLDHLLHGFIEGTEALFNHLNLDAIKIKYLNSYKLMPNIANGPVSISKRLSKAVQWPNISVGEDLQFNINVYNLKFKAGIIEDVLYLYRRNYSSFNN